MKHGPKPRQVTQDLLEQIEHHVARLARNRFVMP